MNLGQIAYHEATGLVAEAFSATDEQWNAICAAPRGDWLMPRSGWPAVAKTSINGLRFFAHHPGFQGILPRPESYAHTRLKIDIVKAARAIGYDANLEVAGCDSEGNNWIADVLVTLAEGQKFAFEVQLSSQHINDFRTRTERYHRSGVSCCWVISHRPVEERLKKAILRETSDYFKTHGEYQSDLEEFPLLRIQLESKDHYPDDRPILSFSRGKNIRRMEMEEAIGGVLSGKAKWEQPYWHWV